MSTPDLNKTNRSSEFSDTNNKTTSDPIGNDSLTIIPDIDGQRVMLEKTDTESANHLNQNHLNQSADSALSLTKPQSSIESTLHQQPL